LAEKNERLQNQLKVRVHDDDLIFFRGWIWIFWGFFLDVEERFSRHQGRDQRDGHG
jgi:hypothetical protein